MGASVLEIHWVFDYINKEIDDTHFQYNTLSLLCISSFFSLSVKLLKHVKLIIFYNYHECKTKHLLLTKKSSNTI